MAPKVSVVMSVYNGERYLREAVDSILGQTFGAFEFVIVDDASTDETPLILSGYTDPRIVFLRNDENLGLTRSLNVGLKMACGEYIARQDADDISLPNRLERQVGLLDEQPGPEPQPHPVTADTPAQPVRLIAQQPVVARVGHGDGEVQRAFLEPAPPVLQRGQVGAAGPGQHGGRVLPLLGQARAQATDHIADALAAKGIPCVPRAVSTPGLSLVAGLRRASVAEVETDAEARAGHQRQHLRVAHEVEV